MDNSLQPAFPIFDANGEFHNDQFGLSKREYFAGLAMQGILSSDPQGSVGGGFNSEVNLCSLSIRIADELLKQLEAK